AKPTYSTCIGLILKGYSDYEHHRKQFETKYTRVEVPEALKKMEMPEDVLDNEEMLQEEKVRNRKGLKDFWGKFKVTLIDLFKEEEDRAL
ncbi:MAG: cell division protein FtsA, partial [Flavitalea sp.]